MKSENRFSHSRDTVQVLSDLESLAQSRDLDTLSRIANRFNLLEATGFLRQELRHSDLLAFLLDPRKPHGLHTAFLDQFLGSLTQVPDSPAGRLRDVLSAPGDPRRITIRREQAHIDITIEDRSRNLIVFIEDKIDSSEHSEQLKRYRQYMCRSYKSYHRLPIFLTPAGDPPIDEHEGNEYQSVSYEEVCRCLEAVRRDQEGQIKDEDRVAVLIDEYVAMLRRHIVTTKDIEKIVLEIYRDHKDAVDLILRERPDLAILRHLQRITEQVIRSTDSLVLGKSAIQEMKRELRIPFWPTVWRDDATRLPPGAALRTHTFFEIYAEPHRVDVKLFVHESVPVRGGATVPGFLETPEAHDKRRAVFARPLLEDPDLDTLGDDLAREWSDWEQNDLPLWQKSIETRMS